MKNDEELKNSPARDTVGANALLAAALTGIEFVVEAIELRVLQVGTHIDRCRCGNRFRCWIWSRRNHWGVPHGGGWGRGRGRGWSCPWWWGWSRRWCRNSIAGLQQQSASCIRAERAKVKQGKIGGKVTRQQLALTNSPTQHAAPLVATPAVQHSGPRKGQRNARSRLKPHARD